MRTFSLYIHNAQSTTPSLAFEMASDEETVRTLAAGMLAESPNHLLVEVREEDRLLFTLDRDDSPTAVRTSKASWVVRAPLGVTRPCTPDWRTRAATFGVVASYTASVP